MGVRGSRKGILTSVRRLWREAVVPEGLLTLVSRWSISAIVLWEISKFAQLGRIDLDLDDPQVVRTLAALQVWPITVEIARASTRLDVRSDPADELIGATSVVHNVPLLTRDRNLRRSRMIPLA